MKYATAIARVQECLSEKALRGGRIDGLLTRQFLPPMPVITEHASTLPSLAGDELFPIREVSRLTGINPVTLRAWERRYGLIQPTRTESGHRLYSARDIETVRQILAWVERGVAVSKVGTLLARAATTPLAEIAGQGLRAQWQGPLAEAIGAFDEARLERLYGQIFSSYPVNQVFEDILMPLWRELALQDDFGQVSEWLFYDAFLRARTLQRLQLNRLDQPRHVLLAGLPGQCRELELLVTALLLGTADTRVSVLAVGQPFAELTLICEKIRPQALVLFSSGAGAGDLPRRLERLAQATECPVLLAGEVADLAQDRLAGSAVGCLGREGLKMQSRLQGFLAATLDT